MKSGGDNFFLIFLRINLAKHRTSVTSLIFDVIFHMLI